MSNDSAQKVIECGCCGGWHREEYNGDCRKNAERFDDPQDAADNLQVPTKICYADGTESPEIFNPGENKW